MFMVALFVKTPHWRQPRCLRKIELINKLWYIYKMEYHRAIRKHDIMACNNVDEYHTDLNFSKTNHM